MKVLFIYNPRAGKERIRSNLLDIIDIFTKAGWEVTAYPTQGEGDAVQRVIGASEEYELICVSGGDGTLDEVVNGMMNRVKRCPIGFVPAGSTNDFAMSLGIPTGMKAAAQAIVGGEREAFDIGSLNGDAFTYVAAFGLFTEVSYETNQDMKNLFGHAAYVMEGAKKLSEIRSYAMRIRGDEFSLKGKFLYGMITNSVSVGGFKGITGD
ncbi:MAG: YegS/Rv2252/BmrU family lipid kinase, partial [Butyrivibrio sp.]|nr:YegS/Rv2252/BmrU family lipid kinase [Butyrivibrio sp.]